MIDPRHYIMRVWDYDANHTTPADLRDWMLGEISPLLKVNTKIVSV